MANRDKKLSKFVEIIINLFNLNVYVAFSDNNQFIPDGITDKHMTPIL